MALGFLEFDVYLTLSVSSVSKREQFEQALIASENVSLIIELGGEYEYAVTICSRNPSEVSTFFDNLGKRFGDVIFAKAVAIRRVYTGFGRKYLMNKKVNPIVQMQFEKKTCTIDETDHEVLKGLSRNDFSSIAVLARQLKIPATTLEYRIKKLKENKIIVGSIYGISMRFLGVLSYRLILYARGSTEAFRNQLFEFCGQHPNIINFVHGIGAWDFELGVEVERDSDIVPIVRALQAKFVDQINKITTCPIFRFLKVQNYPFSAYPLG
ncbi:MAG: hypothetical protein DCC75_06950 [Proteobacteria bacterium]|nr:MAG: hypothetical protein DCC75_06950 [Pseudomonadota bacterium]